MFVLKSYIAPLEVHLEEQKEEHYLGMIGSEGFFE